MNRSFPFILSMALIMLSWPGALPVDAGPSAGQKGAPTLVADNATETPAEAAAEQTAPPNVMIPDPLFTFDTVVDGSEVVHDFRVYNRGKGELAIEKVQTG